MRDQDIRQILINELTAKFRNHKNTILVQELGLFQGKSRIDIAVINGSLYGYEIKSDSDNLLRLDNQLQAYSKVFDYLTLVVGSSHYTEIKKNIPAWCGLYIAKFSSNQIELKKIRSPKKNILVDAQAIVQLLWREEALNILKNSNLHKGLSKALRSKVWTRLITSTSLNDLKKIIRHALLSRNLWIEHTKDNSTRIKILNSR